jgi:hypothetical protein
MRHSTLLARAFIYIRGVVHRRVVTEDGGPSTRDRAPCSLGPSGRSSDAAPFSSLDGKWKCCGPALPVQSKHTANQHNHIEYPKEFTHHKTLRRTARENRACAALRWIGITFPGCLCHREPRAPALRAEPCASDAPFSLAITIPILQCTPRRCQHRHGRRNPFAFCTRAKSETWLRRKRTPDKRHALRINFQLKTRGQKRKITLMRRALDWVVARSWFSLLETKNKNTHTNQRNQFVITWGPVLV